MKKHQFIELKKLEMPRVDLPLHKQRLKRALLATHQLQMSYGIREEKSFVFNSLSILMKSWKIIALSSFTLLALTLSYYHISDKLGLPSFIDKVSARELVAQASEKLKQLSPEEIASLEEKINNQDIFKTMKAAYEAENLKECNQETCELLKNISLDLENKSLKNLHFIEYATNEERGLIGLSEDNLPALTIVVTSSSLFMASDVGVKGDVWVKGLEEGLEDIPITVETIIDTSKTEVLPTINSMLQWKPQKEPQM